MSPDGIAPLRASGCKSCRTQALDYGLHVMNPLEPAPAGALWTQVLCGACGPVAAWYLSEDFETEGVYERVFEKYAPAIEWVVSGRAAYEEEAGNPVSWLVALVFHAQQLSFAMRAHHGDGFVSWCIQQGQTLAQEQIKREHAAILSGPCPYHGVDGGTPCPDHPAGWCLTRAKAWRERSGVSR